MTDIKQLFGAPRTLDDKQAKALVTLQQATLAYAEILQAHVPHTEDKEKAFTLLKDVQLLGEKAIRFGRGILSPPVIADLFRDVELRNTRVVRFWVNAFNYADIRKFGHDIFDSETSVNKIKEGIHGRVWGAEVRVARKIPKDFVVVVGADEGDVDLHPDWNPVGDKLISI
jgi:hypothetical protein